MASVHIPSCNAFYVHVPKTAGNSISTALVETFGDAESFPSRNMSSLAGAVQHVGPRVGQDVLARCWSFCFLRNPWDWTVSGWRHVTHNKSAYGRSAPDFETFVKGGWKDNLERNPHRLKYATPELYVGYHTQLTQLEHLLGPDGRTLTPMTFFARFEHLAEDWTRICERLGRDIGLTHLNKSKRKNYVEYYTDELRQIVARRNPVLIEKFGYRFGE